MHDLQNRDIHERNLDGLANTHALRKFAPVLIGLLTGINQAERGITWERTLESVQHRRETKAVSVVARKPMRQRNAWCFA